MSLSDPARRASLSARVQGILLRPSAEWDRIDAEPATTRSLFTGYAMILAAITPVCSAIGAIVFGHGIPGFMPYHPNPMFVIVGAVVTYLLSLAAVFVLGLIIDALAPTFSGVKSQVQAMKVAVYSSTATWVGGVFQIFPPLALIGVLFGLYGLYILYRGLPKLMRTAQDKALGYTALAVVCYIVLFFVISLVTAPILLMGSAASSVGGVTVVGQAGGAVSSGVVRLGAHG